ncbi:MAG: hypothetical protein AAF802_33430 [Planctomycetota bacterium]
MQYSTNIFVSMVLIAVLDLTQSYANERSDDPEETNEAIMVVMDEPTAELWRSYFQSIEVNVIVRSDDEPYGTLNARARSVSGAARVYYRGDKSSLVSQFFRERISNQGVKTIDLAKHFRPKTAPRIEDHDGEILRAECSTSRMKLKEDHPCELPLFALLAIAH